MVLLRAFFGKLKYRRAAMLSVLLPSFYVAPAAARYDAFTAEAEKGLDYVAIQSQNYSADGDLGRTVYDGKVKDPYDVFIPTTNYVRLGAGANIGFASSSLKMNGIEEEYDMGFSENFGFGWNLASWARMEMGWRHSDMKFEGARVNDDTANLSLYFDLARRHVMRGDVMYRRRIVPFFGFGAAGGWAAFDNSETERGRGGWTYGGRGAAGLSFAFTETNAIDLTVAYELLFGRNLGWAETEKSIGNTNVSLSWRASF